MEIDRVAADVRRIFAESIIANGPEHKPYIVIYMTRDFYMKSKAEIAGAVSNNAYEFHSHDRIMGFPCYQVIDDSHPSFRVMEVGNESV